MKLHFFTYLVRMAFVAIVFLTLHSCGKQGEGDDELLLKTPTPEPTATTEDIIATPTPIVLENICPTPSPTITVAPARPTVFVGSTSQRFLVAYSSAGVRLKVYDLSPYFSAGGISAMTFIDSSNLMIFFDPGAAGERVVKFNVDTEVFDAGWGIDATNLNNISANYMTYLSGKLFIQKTTNVENYSVDLTNSLFLRNAAGGWPMTSTASCTITTINGVIPATYAGTNYLLQLSSGANTRINTYSNVTGGGALSCAAAGNSYNYTTAAPTGAAYVALSGHQTTDGKVYVRFGHATTPRLVRYDFNGTIISNGTDVFTDPTVLGASTTMRSNLALFGTTEFLMANWDTDALVKVSTTGTSSIFARDGYTVDVGAVAVRPD